MWSISVEPNPSRIGAPKRSSHALPISAGSASPAEAARRSREDPSAASPGGSASIAP